METAAAKGPTIRGVFDYARHIGPVFGSEKIAFLLYSLVRIRRPSYAVELGCGTGATAFCIAEALRDNGHGELLTADNEQAWPQLAAMLPLGEMGFRDQPSMGEYVRALALRFEVADRLTYRKTAIPPFPVPDAPLGLLYADYNHSPQNVLEILAAYLPVMARSGLIVFDSAATAFPTYQMLENLGRCLGTGRIPGILLRGQGKARSMALRALVEQSRITVMHFVEGDKSEQNSASAVFIDPFDAKPSAGAIMRFGSPA